MSLRLVFEWLRDGERCHFTDHPVADDITEIRVELTTEGFTTTARIRQLVPPKDDDKK